MENRGLGARSQASRPLCREPWENYHILRRGIIACSYGSPIAPMCDWERAWNSPALQEIRSYLAKGELAPYCLLTISCPIVQRHLSEHPEAGAVPSTPPPEEPAAALAVANEPRPHALPLRIINRALGRLPARVYRRLRKTAAGQ